MQATLPTDVLEGGGGSFKKFEISHQPLGLENSLIAQNVPKMQVFLALGEMFCVIGMQSVQIYKKVFFSNFIILFLKLFVVPQTYFHFAKKALTCGFEHFASKLRKTVLLVSYLPTWINFDRRINKTLEKV